MQIKILKPEIIINSPQTILNKSSKSWRPHLWGWCPLVWEILDPPLIAIVMVTFVILFVQAALASEVEVFLRGFGQVNTAPVECSLPTLSVLDLQ